MIFVTPHVWLAGLLVSLIGIEHVGLSFFTLYQGISCQYALTLEPQEMVLQQDEDELVKFAYSDLRKVNFTSAPFVGHEFISFIEFLDADFAYHCYPIERVPVKKFDEIVSLLRQPTLLSDSNRRQRRLYFQYYTVAGTPSHDALCFMQFFVMFHYFHAALRVVGYLRIGKCLKRMFHFLLNHR